MPVTHLEVTRHRSATIDNPPTLLVHELHYAYPDGHQALHGVSLHIDSGEKVALVGPNGAGKSTLMLHFNGLLSGQGRLEVAGMPVTTIRHADRSIHDRLAARGWHAHNETAPAKDPSVSGTIFWP